MTDVGDLLRENGVRSAIVIDDVFDEAPRPDELADDVWDIFFDDLSEADQKCIVNLFPGYSDAQFADLKRSDDFIQALWSGRNQLSRGARRALFGEYESRSDVELRALQGLVEELRQLGLKCDTMGAEITDAAKEADLLLVDLFLGFQQQDADIELAIDRVKAIVDGRTAPPLVILMSRSMRLEQHRTDFRDRAGLLGSTFRVASRREIADFANLHRLLRRLAAHYRDAKALARFISAWDRGVDQARSRFVSGLRRLDLSDLAQIRALMLEFEDQKLGDYMLEVADRVLQYEIEAVEETIEAAEDLNDVDLERYPAPHLTGTPDLQDLVCRGMFFHTRRLEGPIRLQFGDLLRWNRRGKGFDVSLVVTPACDLARYSHKGIMLLCGVMEELTPNAWSYRQDPVRTPVVILQDRRWWIRWDLRAVRVVAFDKLMRSIEVSKSVDRIGRLRELHAVELQQKMLASLGRVGTPANPPIAFSVQVSLYYVGEDSKLKALDEFGRHEAACYVGRDASSKSVYRLVLREGVCDDVERCLGNLSDKDVVESARSSLSVVRDSRSFVEVLERGEISVPELGGGPKPILVGNQIVAIVIRDQQFGEDSPIPKNGRRAALIFSVADYDGGEV